MIKPTLSACLAALMALVAGSSAFLVVAIQPAIAGTLLPHIGGNATLWQCLQVWAHQPPE